MSVDISSYSNPSHRHYEGGCCDLLISWKGNCLGSCDNYFIVCVEAGEEDDEVCKNTGEVGDNDHLFFTSRVGNLPNPILFPVAGSWTVSTSYHRQ